YIYGMTGGQTAPTTPLNVHTKTAPYGNIEPAFDACALAKAAGATYVSRQTVVYPRQLQLELQKAVEHDGFSFVEVMTQCPTQAGRNIFGSGEPEFLFKQLKKQSVLKKDQQLESGEFYIGRVHHDETKAAYQPPKV
ncbi:MAG: thiamine pyrophosphate-dependent enzyme, partial [Sporomusa sp.]